MGMEDLYRELILEHYKHPRNHGELDPADVKQSDSNPLCGDEITMTLRIADGRVTDVRFNGRGCAISQASASLLTEDIKGKALEAIGRMTAQDVIDNLGVEVSPARRKCAVLGLKVLQGGLFGLQIWPDEAVRGAPGGDGSPPRSQLRGSG